MKIRFLEVPSGRDTGILPSFELRLQHIRDVRVNSYLCVCPTDAGVPDALFGEQEGEEGERNGKMPTAQAAMQDMLPAHSQTL